MREFWIGVAMVAALAFTATPAVAQPVATPSASLQSEIDRVQLRFDSVSEGAEQDILALIDQLDRETGLGTEVAKDWGDRLRGIYANQRRDAEKIALLERYLRSNEERHGPDSEAALDWVVRLGHDLEGLEQYAQAEAYFVRYLETRRRLNAVPTDDTRYELLEAARNLANFSERLQLWDDAERYWLEVIAVSTEREGEAADSTIEWMDFLARSYGDAKRFDRQIPLLERMIALRVENYGPDDFDAMMARQRLVEALEVSGRREEALAVNQLVIEYDRRHAEPDSALDQLSDERQRRLLMELGRIAEVESMLLEDLRMVRAMGDDDTLIIPLLYLGEHYSRTGDFEKAEDYFKQAVAHTEATNPDDGFRSDLAGLAGFYVRTGRYADAETLLRRFYELRNESLRRANLDGIDEPALVSLIQVIAAQGRYGEAEELILEGLSHGQIDDVVAGLRSELAAIYVAQSRYDEALPILERLYTVAARVGGFEGYNARIYNERIAHVYERMGDLDGARTIYEDNLRDFTRSLGETNEQTRSTRQSLAAVYRRMGRLDDAEPLITQMIAASGDAFDVNSINLRNELALIKSQRGDNAAALEILEKLSSDARERLGKTNPSSLVLTANTVDIALRAGEADRALAVARTLVLGLDERRIALSSEIAADSELGGSSNSDEAGYTLFADAAWEAKRTLSTNQGTIETEVYSALQNAMSGKTDRAIARSAARRIAEQRGGGLAELARRAEELEERRDGINRAIAQSFNDGSEAAVRLREAKAGERMVLNAEMAALNIDLRAQYPDYFALVRADPVSLEATGAMLEPEEAILILVPGNDGTHVMTVADGKLSWHVSGLSQFEVATYVRQLLFFLGGNVDASAEERGNWLGQVEGGFNGFDRSAAFNLYRSLIEPIAGSLAGKERVFVAASGALSTLPLAVLVTGEPQGSDASPDDLRTTDWFGDRHALVQIPSVQSLQFLRGAREAQPQSAILFKGFGDPALEGEALVRRRGANTAIGGNARRVFRSTGMDATIDLEELRGLARLPGTAEEIRAMADLFGQSSSTVLLGAAATETAVKQADFSGVQVLAFATHGLTAGEVEGAVEPGLVFTPPDSIASIDDGLLTASEVSQLDLDADWVILSACNTAAGDGSVGARGMSGLAKAFFYAGAANLLASHWPVRDDVASVLTVRAIAIAREKPELSRAAAFAQAMREIRGDTRSDRINDEGVELSWAHPNAWAPFTLIGDGR